MKVRTLADLRQIQKAMAQRAAQAAATPAAGQPGSGALTVQPA